MPGKPDQVEELNATNLADSVDWRTKGAVNSIQDQKRCGGCWAFSAVAAMEGAHFIKTGKLLKLSEQQCIECASRAFGCRGGYPSDCFDYAELDNMDLEVDYPFTGYDDSCWSKAGGPVRVTTFKGVTRNSAA